jgi:hypothetical protein
MGQDAGHRRGHDLIGLGAHGHRRRHADENQDWGHQEPAADPEDAREQPYNASQAKQQEDVDGQFGDRQVDLHRWVIIRAAVPSGTVMAAV